MRFLAAVGSEEEKPAGGIFSEEPDADDPLLGKCLDDFRITGLLAQGGMGRVYKAVRERDGRKCVVKTLLPDAAGSSRMAERFRREMEMAAILDHPNIVAPLGGGEAEGLLYLAMEYFPGVDLRKRFYKKPAPVQGVLIVAQQAASALACAHENDIVHRDIKPDNILADRHGNTKILDFGIAKLLDDEAFFSLTMSQGTLGTPGYMAPEQMANPRDVDPRSDLYSLGATLYFCLAGRGPFAGKGLADLLHAKQEEVPDIAAARPDTPPALAGIVTRCLAPDPENRPASAGEILTALQA